MIDIHTIAAGGGSIVRYKDGRLLVGPQSAGANPGPACYRNGGPLTVTDCNVLLGKLRGEFFPAVFGKARNQPLNEATVHKKFKQEARKNGTFPDGTGRRFFCVWPWKTWPAPFAAFQWHAG